MMYHGMKNRLLFQGLDMNGCDMETYRIVTNGIKYRIESLHNYRFIWWVWSRWRLVYRYVQLDYSEIVIAEYASLQEAQEDVDYLNRRNEAKKHGWQPIGEVESNIEFSGGVSRSAGMIG